MAPDHGVGALRGTAPGACAHPFDTDRDVLPLLKDAPRDELPRAVRGEAVLSPALAGHLMGQVRTPGTDALSARELEVLLLVAAGTTNREAARALFISEATVKTHLLHVYAKLAVRDRASAVAAGYQRGLLETGTS